MPYTDEFMRSRDAPPDPQPQPALRRAPRPSDSKLAALVAIIEVTIPKMIMRIKTSRGLRQLDKEALKRQVSTLAHRHLPASTAWLELRGFADIVGAHRLEMLDVKTLRQMQRTLRAIKKKTGSKTVKLRLGSSELEVTSPNGTRFVLGWDPELGGLSVRADMSAVSLAVFPSSPTAVVLVPG
jgi:hypothetical protein